MTQSPGLPPSSREARLHPLDDPLTPFFFKGFFRLMYWSFFKPSAYYDYVQSILGNDADKDGWANFRAALRRPQFVRLLLGCLFLVIIVSTVVDIAIGLLSPETFSLLRVAAGVVAGAAVGVAVSIAAIGTLGVAVGVTGGVAFGMMVGAAVGVVGPVTGGIVDSLAIGTVMAVDVGIAYGVRSGVAFNMAVTVIGFAVVGMLGIATGMTGGVAFGIGLIAGFIRLPIYLFQFVVSLALHRTNTNNFLRLCPAIWDEFLVLPQPRLAHILYAALEDDPGKGLQACGRIVINPFQRWAVQRALCTWLDKNPKRTYSTVDLLLREPTPYRTPSLATVKSDGACNS